MFSVRAPYTQVFWRLAPTSVFLSSSVRTKPLGVAFPPAGLGDPEAIHWASYPGRGWTRRPPTPLPGSWHNLSIFFGRRWGGPSPVLTPCLACLPGGPMVLVPLWLHQGNPMFHCCDSHGITSLSFTFYLFNRVIS